MSEENEINTVGDLLGALKGYPPETDLVVLHRLKYSVNTVFPIESVLEVMRGKETAMLAIIISGDEKAR